MSLVGVALQTPAAAAVDTCAFDAKVTCVLVGGIHAAL